MGPAGGSHDNTTSRTPFERPKVATASTVAWLDWVSFGGAGCWTDAPEERHSFFGIAPAGTERLTVTAAGDREREVPITPWNGAWVVVAPGRQSTLTGYDAGGDVLGTLRSS